MASSISTQRAVAPADRGSLEVWIGLIIALGMGTFYLMFEWIGDPTPSGPLEHLMGIGGTGLMLFTEFAYMARKRVSWFKLGRLRGWLSLHVITGIVGPAMVIFHTTFKYNGLALLATVMTLLVVLSGFLGRYLYTAIPRSVAGTELSRDDLTAQAQVARARLAAFLAGKPDHVHQISAAMQARPARSAEGSMGGVLLRFLDDARYRGQVRSALRRVDRREQALAGQLAELQRAARQAERQLARLDAARKLLGLWHLVHFPLGLTLFGSALIHVIAVYYYGAAVIP